MPGRAADASAVRPVLSLQVWHLLIAFLGALAAPAYALGAAPVQAALVGMLVVALVVLVGAKRAQRALA